MTKVLSLTVFAEPSNVRDGQTDGQTDRIGITIGDLMLRADALASVAKNEGFKCCCLILCSVMENLKWAVGDTEIDWIWRYRPNGRQMVRALDHHAGGVFFTTGINFSSQH